jgi:hypothetical protein
MSEDIWTVIARLRRAQPRNPDTLAVCAALEQALLAKPKTEAKFDRNVYNREYMRDYMRRRRAKLKTAMDGDPK